MLRRVFQIVTGVLLGCVVLAVVFLLAPPPSPGPVRWGGEAVRPDPVPAPELRLTSASGEPVRLEDFRGRTVLVFFGFANCPDVCPATLHHWSRALRELEGRDLAFQGLFVTVDPERDTPDALAGWMEPFHPSLIALTGAPDEIRDAADSWDVFVAVREPGERHGLAAGGHAGHGAGHGEPEQGESEAEAPGAPEEGYTVDHFARTFVVDGEGRVVRTLSAGTDADHLVEILTPLLEP